MHFRCCFSLAAFLLGLIAAAICAADPPAPGWTTAARVVSVYDGDTLTVEVRRTIHVRLLDCWAPEVRGKSKTAGLAARDHLRQLLPAGAAVTLHVPTSADGDIQDAWTFGRVLGRVWRGDTDVSAAMVESGHATKRRAEP